MKRTVLLAIGLLAAFAANGQKTSPDGGISAELLSRLEASFEGNATDKALRNALAGTAINVLAASADEAAITDTHFSDIVPTKGHTDQRSSGRCWLFTGLNVLRAQMIREHGLGNFTFSQNYLFFYDQLEKSNLFLQSVIDTRKLPMDNRKVDWLFANPIGDGGQFTGVANLIMKYGVVPSEAMAETYSANNTAQMRSRLRALLREGGLRLRETPEKQLQQRKEEILTQVYRVLALCLGTPPKSFSWTRYNAKGEIAAPAKEYTPLEFYREFLGDDLENNYIMVMNNPAVPYGKVYEIDCDRHVYDGQNWIYLNLPMEDIKKMAIASIKDGTALYFSCDVGKFLDRKKGVANPDNFDYSSLLGVPFTMDKKERILTHDSGSTHAMTLIAVDILDSKPVKWMVENSWGDSSGYKGNIIMTDGWFDEYMFRLVVRKNYAGADVLKLMEQKPVLLPAWDPMFAPED